METFEFAADSFDTAPASPNSWYWARPWAYMRQEGIQFALQILHRCSTTRVGIRAFTHMHVKPYEYTLAVLGYVRYLLPT